MNDVREIFYTPMSSQPSYAMPSCSSGDGLRAPEQSKDQRRDEDASSQMCDEGCLNGHTATLPDDTIIQQCVTVDAMETPMPDTIKTGTIMIEEGTLLPKSVRLESEPYSKGWRKINHLNSRGVDQNIGKAGWTFFYMAMEIKAAAFGFDRQKRLRRAIKRLLAQVKSENFNCMEITELTAKHFLGVPYVNVSAHPRHIQKGLYLFQAKDAVEGDRAKWVATGAAA